MTCLLTCHLTVPQMTLTDLAFVRMEWTVIHFTCASSKRLLANLDSKNDAYVLKTMNTRDLTVCRYSEHISTHINIISCSKTILCRVLINCGFILQTERFAGLKNFRGFHQIFIEKCCGILHLKHLNNTIIQSLYNINIHGKLSLYS